MPALTQNQKQNALKILSLITDEEYAVYMAILGKETKSFVVRNESNLLNFLEREEVLLEEDFKELKSETREDFQSKNKTSSKLERKFPTKAKYTLISQEELAKIFGGNLNWSNFHKKYPDTGGFSTFSRVGFSKDGLQALVFVGWSCGGLCGEGNYYFLKKENGEWKVVTKEMVWIS